MRAYARRLRRRVSPPSTRAPSDRFRPLLASAVACLAPACVSPEVSAQLGYTSMAVSGDLALREGGSNTGPQDIGDTFGLGSSQASAFGRVDVDLGVPEFAASLFWLRESGSGVLADDFGALPAGTAVSSDLDLGVAKLVAAAGFDLGPVTIAPGALFDVFSIDFRATATAFGGREEIDEIVMVPMPFVRGEWTIGTVRLAGEFAWLDTTGLTATAGRFFDVEALVEWQAWKDVSVVAGYRAIDADAEGDSAGDIHIDLQVRGWFVGGGLRF